MKRGLGWLWLLSLVCEGVYLTLTLSLCCRRSSIPSTVWPVFWGAARQNHGSANGYVLLQAQQGTTIIDDLRWSAGIIQILINEKFSCEAGVKRGRRGWSGRRLRRGKKRYSVPFPPPPPPCAPPQGEFPFPLPLLTPATHSQTTKNPPLCF